MRICLVRRGAAGALLAVVLTGCSGTSQTTPVQNAAIVSAMSPVASKASSLLYVSNASNVTVYNYENGSGIILVGTLTGFKTPGGMCTDAAGDVWITDYNSRNIYEYAHGGSSPIATITQKLGYPYACAVDNATGNLAVSYEHPYGHYRNYAEVLIYAKGYRIGSSYGPKTGFHRAYFLAYDDNSNLYATGNACGYNNCYIAGLIHLFKLARGGTFFRLVQGAAKQAAPSGLAWVNPFLLVGNGKSGNGAADALKVQIAGYRSTVIGTVPFAQTFLTYGFTRRADLVIVPDYAANAVQIYRLSDGSLVGSFTQGLYQPFSAVVSEKE